MFFAHTSRENHLVFPLTYLENDHFAIICLEVECPGGSDEAVGLVHHILPKSSDQSQGVQQVNPWHHGLQLHNKEAMLSTLFFANIHPDY